MSLCGEIALNLHDPCITATLVSFRQSTVHAVAGIGDPWRFFDHLRRARLRLIEHPFPDHYVFRAGDLHFREDLPVLMTEKDAVKCAAIDLGEAWVLPVAATIEPAHDGTTLLGTILEKLDGRTPA